MWQRKIYSDYGEDWRATTAKCGRHCQWSLQTRDDQKMKRRKVLIGAVEKQQKLSEESEETGGGSGFRWSGKEPGDVGRRKASLSGHTVRCFFFFLLSLGLELFPEGPLQLRDRQSEGEGAVRL